MNDILRQFTMSKVAMAILLANLAILIFVPVQAQTPTGNHIGLVVVHGNSQVTTRCVAFNENEINGYELLARSGLDLIFQAGGTGTGVCRIDHEGCTPQDSCLCQCAGGDCRYWSYWLWSGTTWQYSNVGAANQIGHNGDVQGWRWGLGNVDAATPPPVIAFSEICKAESGTATPSVTPSPTLTITGSPTTTPQPTLSPTASLTPVPGAATATATATATLPQSPLATPSATPVPTPIPTPIETPVPTPIVASAPTPVPAPGILAFSANPAVIDAGASTVLTWRLANAESAVLRTNNGEEALATGDNNFVGNKSITPAQTTVYTLVARSLGGEAATQVTITVNALIVTPILPITGPITVSSLAPLTDGQGQLMGAVSTTNVVQATSLPEPPTATLTPTLAPVRFDLTPTLLPIANSLTQADPAEQEQTQRLLIFGGVALAVIVPLGIAGLALLIWTIVRHI